MAGIGRDLVVNLAGNNSKLKSTLAESKGGLKGFASSAAGFLSPVTAGLTAVAGAAVAAGLAIYGLQGNIATLDAVAKNAARAGVSGKFLQQLTFAADQSGVASDKVIDALKDMTIKIGQASSGNETLISTFGKLGLSLSDLQRMTPEDQFKKIFESISKLPTAAQRSAAAVEAFGEAGHQMTTLFSGGVEGLNSLLERAAELGIGVNAEGLKKIEAANDAIGQMKASFGALLDQITVGLAPAFEYVAKTITNIVPPVTLLFEKFNAMEGKAQFLGDILKAAVDVGIENIRLNWSNMLDGMIDDVAGFGRKIGPLLAEASNPLTWLDGIKTDDLKANNQGEGLAAAQNRLQNLINKLQVVNPQVVKPFVPQGPKVPIKDDGSKLKGLFTGIVDAAGPLVDAAKSKLGQAIGSAKVDAGFWADVGKKAIGVGGDKIKPETPEKQELRFAGAMQKGSAEAYSTIIASMFGNKDPNVKATEKQTKEIVKAIKGQKGSPMNLVAEFAV